MEIKNKKLISINSSDIIDGKFINNEITDNAYGLNKIEKLITF